MTKRAIPFKNYLLKGINPVVRFLILSDVIVLGSAELLNPIFAIYITEYIIGGNAAVAGVAFSIFFFTRSVFQIPCAYIIDKIRGEQDDFHILVFFSILTALIPLLYLFISQAWHLYIIQFCLGLTTAFTFPSYRAIFTRHIDKTKEGTEWAIYFTMTGVSSAALAAIGGYIASTIGFPFLIVSLATLSLLGTLLLLPIKPYIRSR